VSCFCPFWMCVGLKEEMDRRVQKFRTDYADLRNQFDILKKEADAQVCLIAPHSWSCFLFLNLTVSQQAFAQRSELLSTTAIPLTPNNSSARQRFSQFSSSSSTPDTPNRPSEPPRPNQTPMPTLQIKTRTHQCPAKTTPCTNILSYNPPKPV